MIKKKTRSFGIIVMVILISIVSLRNLFSQDLNHGFIEDSLPKNYVKDGSKDYTSIVQRIINEYDIVTFPNFPILVNDSGLKIGSNKTLLFLPKSALILSASNKTHYSVLLIQNSENVTINNPRIIGDRDVHIGDKGEWGMGIKIEGSRNVRIINGIISKCWGDGIYIGNGKSVPNNIHISNTKIGDIRRNGISIISGNNITIDCVEIENINGVLPMAGIDIEPNSQNDNLGKILIKNIKTRNNNSGIQIGLRNYPSEDYREIDIQIKDMTSKNDNHGLLIGDLFRKAKYGPQIKPLRGKIDIKNVKIDDSQKEPIKYYSPYGYDYSPFVIFKDIKIYKNNRALNPSRIKNDLNQRKFDTNAF